MAFDIGAASDVGRRRSANEDAYKVLSLPSGALCVVADGMGGHQAGEVASMLAVETIRDTFLGGNECSIEALVRAIQAANSVVVRESAADAAKQGMGTTVVSALLEEGRAQLANVGDSPAFLVRGAQAKQLTQDHSWVAEELTRGALKPDEAAVHPYRHILTRCLGLAEQVEIQTYQPVALEAGDVLVLCSDGLSEHVKTDDLPTAVYGSSAEAAARALVDLANQRGGSDNITVIVARWE